MLVDDVPAGWEMDRVTQTVAFQCKNCGLCCGPVPLSVAEQRRIKAYVARNLSMDYVETVMKQKKPPLTCGFRDVEQKICIIHPVRPEICKMQGYYEGLPCPHQPHFATKSREEGRKRLELME